MRRCAWIGALLLALPAGGLASAGESPCCEPNGRCFLERVGPAGGWCPYGGGLLHWWNPHCFPCYCGPDDYCRKPPPCACLPAYPPWYVWRLPPAGPEQHDAHGPIPAGPPDPGPARARTGAALRELAPAPDPARPDHFAEIREVVPER